ncbi:phosphonate ABC transporter permease [Rhodococcoides trifolii]|uniref:Phosphonate ABC transporter permease n=1 Tax=Rhodococcoides trifolii TaxID=908250 RepID=A0A917LHH2_9NOCA|nr:phosphonate ABC transporter, permease protein PhnE [Rhodococcus trifolii]GGG24051.1 phosphonate ABC transporter permease [Rhodococcus trifolii]
MTTLAVRRLAVPPRPRRRTGLIAAAVIVAALIALHWWAVRETDVSVTALVSGWSGIVDFLESAVPPDFTWATVVKPGIEACLVTLAIGLVGTTFSIPFSILLAVLGARTTSRNSFVYQASRGIMSFLRAVPDIVFALIFVTAVGLGPFAGVLAIILHNTGVMAKLWSEAMEEIDSGPSDALRVAGASSAQVAAHVVLPTVVPTFVGLLLYRLDVNVRSSLVLGLVGAGGIGFLINQSISLFRFDEMMTYILMVLVLVVAVDLLSGAVRKRLAV